MAPQKKGTEIDLDNSNNHNTGNNRRGNWQVTIQTTKFSPIYKYVT